MDVVFVVVYEPRAYMLKKSAWLLHQIGGKAPLAARKRSEVERADVAYLLP